MSTTAIADKVQGQCKTKSILGKDNTRQTQYKTKTMQDKDNTRQRQ